MPVTSNELTFTVSENERVIVSAVRSREKESSSGGVVSEVKSVTGSGCDANTETTLFSAMSRTVVLDSEMKVLLPSTAKFCNFLMELRSSRVMFRMIMVPLLL